MILPKNRLFEAAAPSEDAKSFYIFCEGKNREPDYFRYFEAIDSRIKMVIIRAETYDNNSPTGLYDKACQYLIPTHDNPNTKYELLDIDEVWFVIDTDSWGNKIEELRLSCQSHTNWFIAQSNPCFEVWLYYHFKQEKPNFAGMEISKNWKGHVNGIVNGGFDSRKHPIFIEKAIENAKNNYIQQPSLGNTQVFELGENILPLIQETIRDGLQKMIV